MKSMFDAMMNGVHNRTNEINIKLVLTNKKPDKPGWYLLETKAGEINILFVAEDDIEANKTHPYYLDEKGWCGPIEIERIKQ